MTLATAPNTAKAQAVARVMRAAAEHARSFATVSTHSGRIFFVPTTTHGQFRENETVVIEPKALEGQLEVWSAETYKHYGLTSDEITKEMSLNALAIRHGLWEVVDFTEPDVLELLLDWARD